jgi:hypothetical protein
MNARRSMYDAPSTRTIDVASFDDIADELVQAIVESDRFT